MKRTWIGQLRERLMEHPQFPWWVFSFVTIGTFMVNVDMSVTNIALPTLKKAFDTSIDTLQWVLTGYLLIITGILPLVGKLSDLYGRKPFFIAGVLSFGLFSALAATAHSLQALILYRMLQGIGSALIQGNVMSIVADYFPPERRGRPLGMIGSVVAIGTIVGPSIGGFLITFSGWPAIFWLNVPFSLISFLGAMILLKGGGRKTRQVAVDYLSAAYFFVAISLLMLFISSLGKPPLLPAPLSAFQNVIFTLLTVVFWYLYIQRSLHQKDPLIHLSLFRIRMFSIGNGVGLLSYMLLAVPQITLPFYLEFVYGYTPDVVGLLMIVEAVAMIVAAPLAGAWSERIGTRRPALVGLLVTFLSLVLMSLAGIPLFAPTKLVGLSWIIIGLALFGTGMGLFQAPNNVAVLNSVPKEQTGLTGGIIATVRNLGRVLGVALVVLIYERVSGGLVLPSAVTAGMQAVMWIGALATLVGWALNYYGQRAPQSRKAKDVHSS